MKTLIQKEITLVSPTTEVTLRASLSNKGLEIDMKGLGQPISFQRDGVEYASISAAGVVTAAAGFAGPVDGAVTGNVTGDVTGNLTGNVTGDVTGDVTGNLTGNVTGDVAGDLTGTASVATAIAEGTPVNAVAATGTITITVGQNPADGNTVTINGRAYTFKTALTAEPVVDEVLIGGDPPATSANLVLAIMHGAGEGVNYSTGTVVNAHVTATSVDNVTTLTSKTKGVIGNTYTLAKVGDNLTVSAATMGTGGGVTPGVDGTVGAARTLLADANYYYLAIAANTTADTNWRRYAVGNVY